MSPTPQEFLHYVLSQIVAVPDALEVSQSEDALGILVTVRVHNDDMGKIIGKNGQTAKSLRTLLHVMGSKKEQRVNLKILEPAPTA